MSLSQKQAIYLYSTKSIHHNSQPFIRTEPSWSFSLQLFMAKTQSDFDTCWSSKSWLVKIMQSMITYIHHTSKLLLRTLIRTSHSRWISPKTSSVGSSNLQQGHVFLFLNHGNMQIQWNKCSHGNSHTSLPSLISSLHITHSTPPPLTSTDGRATTVAADAATSLPVFPSPLLWSQQ